MYKYFLSFAMFCGALAACLATSPAFAAEYVIAISVDGMGSYYASPLLTPGQNQLTNILRLIDEGASTLNARDDADYAITLPNHVTMITSRGVSGEGGHNWSGNSDPLPGETLASNKGTYVASVFDVAHDNGLRTGLWAGKTKFGLFSTSYNSTNGASDATGDDNGRNKIDYNYVVNALAAATLAANFIGQMTADPFNFAFVHFQDPDAAGHSSGWSTSRTSSFAATLKAVDTQIGNIISMVENDPVLNGNTTILLTADHGGHNYTHGDVTNPLDYTVPFIAWGCGVAAAGDLYELNPDSRTAPGANVNPPYSGNQPIRSGEIGNLSLDLLGLGAIPGSSINAAHNLAVPEPSMLAILCIGGVCSTVYYLRKRRWSRIRAFSAAYQRASREDLTAWRGR